MAKISLSEAIWELLKVNAGTKIEAIKVIKEVKRKVFEDREWNEKEIMPKYENR